MLPLWFVKLIHKTLSDNFYLISTWVVLYKKGNKIPSINALKLKKIIKFASFTRVFIFQYKPFFKQKKSVWDIVPIWLLKTAFIILLSNETDDLSIACLCKILLASEWLLPPHSFSCIFIFRTKHIANRNKIYWRYCLYTSSKKILYYSSFMRNPWFVNIMSL